MEASWPVAAMTERLSSGICPAANLCKRCGGIALMNGSISPASRDSPRHKRPRCVRWEHLRKRLVVNNAVGTPSWEQCNLFLQAQSGVQRGGIFPVSLLPKHAFSSLAHVFICYDRGRITRESLEVRERSTGTPRVTLDWPGAHPTGLSIQAETGGNKYPTGPISRPMSVPSCRPLRGVC